MLIRIFFAINSVLALIEAVLGERFFPGYVIEGSIGDRATALTAHPLSGAVLTGMLILFLAFGPRRRLAKPLRIPELALHGAAMIAFGGRAGIAILLAVLVVGGLIIGRKQNEEKVGVFQRMLPIGILAGGFLLITFPPPFVEKALERFNFARDKSAATRFALGDIFQNLTDHQLMWGANRAVLERLMVAFDTPLGIEAAWLQLTATFGLIVIAPLGITFLLFLIKLTAQLDRAARYAAVYFLAVTATSLSIGSKSLLVSQFFLMLITIGRPVELGARRADV